MWRNASLILTDKDKRGRSSPAIIRERITSADVVIGAVLIPGAKAPHLVTRDMLKIMKPGSVLVDVAIDQGGCFETAECPARKNK